MFEKKASGENELDLYDEVVEMNWLFRMRWFLFSMVMIFVFAILAFYYFSTATFPFTKPARPLVVDDYVAGKVDVGIEQVGYFLVEIGAYQLHNPPGMSETPKIEVYVGEMVFGAEVVEGIVNVKEKEMVEADIQIIISEDDFLNALKSGDVTQYVKGAIAENRVKMIKLSSSSVLFSKGYLNMYNALMDKGITGNMIGIFSE